MNVNVVETGFSSISLHQQNVKVFKNDAVVIASSTDNPNIIQFVKSESKKARFFQQKQLQVGDEISIGKNLTRMSNHVPLISVITVRPFFAPLPQFVAMETGELIVKASFQDGRNNRESINKTFKVQVHDISNLFDFFFILKEHWIKVN